MEWCIPIQTLQVDNVQVGNTPVGPKPMISLSYRDTDLHFSCLTLLLPKLTIKSYTPSSGRLIMSLDDSIQTVSKLSALQDILLSAVYSNQQRWFPRNTSLRKMSEIKDTFQSIIHDTDMNLYCPINENDEQGPNVYRDGVWSRGILQSGILSPGSSIRIVVKLQGLSFHVYPSSDQWSGKFRLQHRILAVLIS
jgi:hypothetical protein